MSFDDAGTEVHVTVVYDYDDETITSRVSNFVRTWRRVYFTIIPEPYLRPRRDTIHRPETIESRTTHK